MTYITPPVFVAGTALAAADLNIMGSDIGDLDARVTAMAFEGVALARTTNLSVVTATFTDVPWSSASIDVSGWWTSGANITVPSGAVPPGFTSVVLEIDASCRFAANGTGSRAVEILLNGGVVEHAKYSSAISGETTTVDITVWAVAAAADVIKVDVYQTSGGNLDASQISAHVKRIGYL